MKTRTLQLIFCLFLCTIGKAQFPYSESFKNSTVSGLIVSGAAKLTAASGIDPVGQGYLRLTENANNSVGYVYGVDSFPSNYGLTINFEFFSWKTGANSTNQADGMTFFLFDASVNAFRPGGTGGALGYAQYYSTPGLAKGYMGISIDNFGNFSSAADGAKNGGPGQQRSSVAIRGPGNGKSTTDYVYQTGVTTTDIWYNIGFLGFTQRYPDATSANYRKMKIILTPGSSLGPAQGYKVTVIMYKGGGSLTPVTLINNFDYPFLAPAQLQFGLAGSTGSITNQFEVRNLTIDATNTSALVAPTTVADNGAATCQGQQSLIDVTANDRSNNTGGMIDKTSVDLNPTLAGQQNSFADAGKGNYMVDSNGIVTFTPLAGFSGVSTISYLVSDNYGIVATTNTTITVNVSSSTGPALVLTDPASVCLPLTVNITNPSLRTLSTPGATYTYFKSLADASTNSNSINATATAISQPGIYYIKSALSGCETIKPITVSIHQTPTVSNAGADLSFCSSTGGQTASLLANNPDAGIGAWTQISGPTTAAVTFPESPSTPLLNLAKGVYVYRWSITNGACTTSSDDVQISVGVVANAGTTQTVVNASTATLAGNIVSPATGTWSVVSGSGISITEPSNPASAITGMVPGNSYTLNWRAVNGTCTSNNQVLITDVLNTIANAGPDQAVGNLLGFTLHGNTPGAANTGVWTLVSAPFGGLAVVLTPFAPTASVLSVNVIGKYVFQWTMSNGAYSNSDQVAIYVGSILPVTLSKFSGNVIGSDIRLNWETATELNSDYFIVERSYDGITFEPIVKVAAAGTSTSTKDYEYGDKNLPVDKRVFYYRLRQVDFDGNEHVSNTIKLIRSVNSQLSIWPNPVKNKLYVQLRPATAGKALFRIFDMKGTLVGEQMRNVSAGMNVIEIENLDRLATGQYNLYVTKDDERFVFPFMK